MPTLFIEIDNAKRPRVDAPRRLRETAQDLGFRSLRAAEQAAGLSNSQLHHAVHRNPPGSVLLERIARGWGVPPLVFYLTREEAAPLLAALPPRPPEPPRKNVARGTWRAKKNAERSTPLSLLTKEASLTKEAPKSLSAKKTCK